MPSPGRRERQWQRMGQGLRTLPARTPLRVKVTATILVCVLAALAIISVAGITFLRQYLLNGVNAQLSSLTQQQQDLDRAVNDYLGGRPQQPASISLQWLGATGPVQQVLYVQTRVYSGAQPGQLSPPAVHRGDSWLATGSAVSNPVTVRAVSGGGYWQVQSYTVPYNNRGGGGTLTGTIIVGIDVTSIYQTLGRLAMLDVLISLGTLLVLAVIAITVIRASLRPLDEIKQTAEAIAAGDLSRRVPEADPRTEVGSLGQSFNAMLTQIEAAFAARTRSEVTARRSEERMRRFIADASHELRTPLTTIRGFAEYYRQRGGVDGPREPVSTAGLMEDLATAATSARSRGTLSHAELDRLIKRVEQEAARMGVLVEDLLLLARLDQQRPLEFRTVDLLAIASDSVHDARVIAPRRAITLTMDTSRVPLVPGDEVRLRQVVGNLINNALTHTPDGTPIEVTISSGTLAAAPVSAAANGAAPPVGVPGAAPPVPAVVFKVSDHGPGLTQEQAEHVFERFYRTDRARTRTAGGTGLGLAIVAALIAAHHGQVWVESVLGTGTTFGFALPLSAEALAAGQDEDSDEPGHDPASASSAAPA